MSTKKIFEYLKALSSFIKLPPHKGIILYALSLNKRPIPCLGAYKGETSFYTHKIQKKTYKVFRTYVNQFMQFIRN